MMRPKFLHFFVLLALYPSSTLSCDIRPFMTIDAFIYGRYTPLQLIRSVNIKALKNYEGIEVTNVTVPQLCEEAISNLPLLTTLSMNSVGLKEVQPGVFKDVPKLARVSFSLNELREVKKGVFNNLHLVAVYLSGNRIERIEDGAFDYMPELREVNLDRNKLRIMSGGWFGSINSLRKINLGYNLIENIPARVFENLETDGVLTVNLNHNKIKEFNKAALRGDEYDLVLEMAYNDIDNFDIEFFKMVKHIKELNLKGNKIECLNGEVLTFYVNEPLVLNLEKNPIECQCLLNLNRFKRVHYKENFLFSTTNECSTLYSF